MDSPPRTPSTPRALRAGQSPSIVGVSQRASRALVSFVLLVVPLQPAPAWVPALAATRLRFAVAGMSGGWVPEPRQPGAGAGFLARRAGRRAVSKRHDPLFRS